MYWTRREMLAAGAGSLVGWVARGDDAAEEPRSPLGVVIHSYGIHRSADRERFDDPLDFLKLCRLRGASGVQTSLGVREDPYTDRLRAYLETHQLYLEGSISLPRSQADVERFAAEVRTAKRSGAAVFRTVLTSGRRYEVFDSSTAFRQFRKLGLEALARARPVVEKHEVSMAVENHKDLQAAELLEIIKTLGCPFIGVCLDTGNNIALLETPGQTVDLLAPHAFTTHVKDMGVEEYVDGFLLSEVALGTGFLKVPELIGTLRRHHPEIRLNLEMITRDPLKIPCLKPKYWITLESIPGRRLAEMLALVREKAGKPLPRISKLGRAEQLQREDDAVRQSLRVAREQLAN